MPFPIGSPLEPNLYLERFPRYSTSTITSQTTTATDGRNTVA